MILYTLSQTLPLMIPQSCPKDNSLNRWSNNNLECDGSPCESISKSQCIDSMLSQCKQLLSVLSSQSNHNHSLSQNAEVEDKSMQMKKEEGTIGELIDEITFKKKKHIRKNNHKSETNSLQNSYEFDSKSSKSDQSKCWSQEEQDLFYEMLEKYGTDFNFIKQAFPRKSKSQIKNKYKQIVNVNKKMKKKGGKDKQLDPSSQIKQMKEIQEQSQNQIIK